MMKVTSKSFVEHIVQTRFLFIVLSVVSGVVLIMNLEGSEMSILVGNLMYIPVTFFMVVSSYILLKKQRKIDDKDRGWLLFFGSTISWLVAEHTWMITELVFHSKPFPSVSDFFYIGGYILMGTFIFKMLWPLKKYISFNIKLLSVLVVSVFLVPTVFLAYNSGGEDMLSLSLSLAYPIMDGILLWPGIIVLCTSFKLKIGKFWSLIAIGIVSLLIGDTSFSYLSSSNSYYTGNPFEIFFYAAYIMIGFASIVRTRQALAHSPLIQEVKESFLEHSGKHATSTWKILSIVSSCTVVVFLVLIFQHDITNDLSTNELNLIIPVGYAVSGISVAMIMLSLILRKKSHSFQSKAKQIQSEFYRKNIETDTENRLVTIQEAIYRLEKKRKIMTPIWVALAIILVVIPTYTITSVLTEDKQSQGTIQSGRFLIENLKGSTINTWAAWYTSPRQTLHVTIVNSNLISDEKLQAIKNAISSSKLALIQTPQDGQSSVDNSVYYDGWKGALESLVQQNPSIRIPTDFEISQSDKAVGDIIIILSTDSETDGSLGFTKAIADPEQHQLLKSFITIFDVTNLSDWELEDIVRHEFGHALGLGHSSNSKDLMYYQFHADNAYISKCDLDALTSLYEGRGPVSFTCTR